MHGWNEPKSNKNSNGKFAERCSSRCGVMRDRNAKDVRNSAKSATENIDDQPHGKNNIQLACWFWKYIFQLRQYENIIVIHNVQWITANKNVCGNNYSLSAHQKMEIRAHWIPTKQVNAKLYCIYLCIVRWLSVFCSATLQRKNHWNCIRKWLFVCRWSILLTGWKIWLKFFSLKMARKMVVGLIIWAKNVFFFVENSDFSGA